MSFQLLPNIDSKQAAAANRAKIARDAVEIVVEDNWPHRLHRAAEQERNRWLAATTMQSVTLTA